MEIDGSQNEKKHLFFLTCRSPSTTTAYFDSAIRLAQLSKLRNNVFHKHVKYSESVSQSVIESVSQSVIQSVSQSVSG